MPPLGTESAIAEVPLQLLGEQALREIISHPTADAFCVKDRQQRYLFCNSPMAALLELGSTAVIGHTDQELQVKTLACSETERRVIESGVAERCTCKLQTNQKVGWYNVQVVPLHLGDKTSVHAIGLWWHDVTDAYLERSLYLGQSRILQRIATGGELESILCDTAQLVEELLLTEAICSIQIRDKASNTLRPGPATSLPQEFIKHFSQVPIEEGAGSCGTAAFRGQTVLVGDIEQDPLWKDYEFIARAFQLRSCWSVPVFAVTAQHLPSQVLGTLAVYGHHACLPRPEQLQVLQAAAYLAGIALDIAEQRQSERERKQAEQALIASEERYRMAVQATQEYIWDIDLTNTHVTWSERYEQAFGRPTDTSNSWQWWIDHLHPEDRDRAYNCFQNAIADGQLFVNCEYRLMRKDGSWADIMDRAYIARGEDGIAYRMVGAMTDVTEQKQSERLQLKLLRIIDESKDFIALAEVSGKLKFMNTGARQMVGIDKEADVSGMHLSDFVAPAHKDCFWHELMPQVLNRGLWEGEMQFVHQSDGRLVDVYRTTFLIHDEYGLPCIASVTRDITARKELEQHVREAQQSDAIGRLAGGVAHDFNNLLTIINGQTDLLLSKRHAEDGIYLSLCEVRDAGQRAAQLTRQLLSFGRRAMVHPQVLDLNATILGAANLIRRFLGEHIKLDLQLSSEDVFIMADSSQMDQLIFNLVVNARDAMPHGGVLTIATKRVNHSDIDSLNVSGAVYGNYVEMLVRDTGTGISNEVIERLFEPFFTTKPTGQGTGLGLAVVQGIVKQSGGHISVQSKLNHGTEFTILMPATNDRPQKTVTRNRQGIYGPVQGLKTVLIVEDEAGVRRLLRSALESEGYRLLEACDADDAQQLADQFGVPIDLLVTDMVMPGEIGWSLANRFRAKWPELPVLYITGYTADFSSQCASISKRDRLLQKPFSPDDLRTAVAKLFDASEEMPEG